MVRYALQPLDPVSDPSQFAQETIRLTVQVFPSASLLSAPNHHPPGYWLRAHNWPKSWPKIRRH